MLKGGYCLEARLSGAARATKDVDFVRREGSSSADDVLDALDTLLDRAVVDDGFVFDAVSAKLLRAPDDPTPAWRVKLECRVDRRLFETVTLDVVSQFREVADAVEPLVIPCPIVATGLEPVTVEAVKVSQHAAEKLHAISRIYAGERPSSRVKDLVDLALLIDAGLLADPAELGRRIVVVYDVRDGRPPPPNLPRPNATWSRDYARLVEDLDLSIRTAEEAFERVQILYRSARAEGLSR